MWIVNKTLLETHKAKWRKQCHVGNCLFYLKHTWTIGERFTEHCPKPNFVLELVMQIASMWFCSVLLK